jgi:hypothetical protein
LDSEGKATRYANWPSLPNSCKSAACLRIGCKAAPCATPVPTHRQCKTFWAAGCWLLGILAEQDRYAHIGSLHGNGVAPEVLGMGKIIGDDSLRRALAAIAPAPNARYSVEERAAQQAQALKAEQWLLTPTEN